MKSLKLETDADGLPVCQDLMCFDFKDPVYEVMDAVNEKLAEHGLTVVQFVDQSDQYYFRIDKM